MYMFPNKTGFTLLKNLQYLKSFLNLFSAGPENVSSDERIFKVFDFISLKDF